MKYLNSHTSIMHSQKCNSSVASIGPNVPCVHLLHVYFWKLTCIRICLCTCTQVVQNIESLLSSCCAVVPLCVYIWHSCTFLKYIWYIWYILYTLHIYVCLSTQVVQNIGSLLSNCCAVVPLCVKICMHVPFWNISDIWCILYILHICVCLSTQVVQLIGSLLCSCCAVVCTIRQSRAALPRVHVYFQYACTIFWHHPPLPI